MKIEMFVVRGLAGKDKKLGRNYISLRQTLHQIRATICFDRQEAEVVADEEAGTCRNVTKGYPAARRGDYWLWSESDDVMEVDRLEDDFAENDLWFDAVLGKKN